MRNLTLLIWTAGLVLLLALVIHYGADAVAGAVAAAGWGLLAVTAFHLVPMTADALAWACLLPRQDRPAFARLLWMRWVGESVNSLLPAAQVGGDLVRGRLAAQRGVAGRDAGASIVVDLSLSVFTLILFCLLGVLLLILQGKLDDLALALLAGLGISAVLLGLLLLVQRLGIFGALARLFAGMARGRDWSRLVGGAGALDQAVAAIYRRRRDVAASTVWAFLAWLLGAGEIWLAMYFLGYPLSVTDALILESLIQAVRSAAFPVPGALGIQEGGFVVLGLLLGVAPETALALSLVKRVRELLLGIPGLVAWHLAESRRLLGPPH